MYKTASHHHAYGRDLQDYLLDDEQEKSAFLGLASAGSGVAGNYLGERDAERYLKRKGYSASQIDAAKARSRGKFMSGLSGFGYGVLGGTAGGLTGSAPLAVAGAVAGGAYGGYRNYKIKRRAMLAKARELKAKDQEKTSSALAGAGAGAVLGGGLGYLSGEGSLYNRRHRVALGAGLGGLGGLGLGMHLNKINRNTGEVSRAIDDLEEGKRLLDEAEEAVDLLPLSEELNWFTKQRIRKAAKKLYESGARAPEGGYRPSKLDLNDVVVPEHVKRKVEADLITPL